MAGRWRKRSGILGAMPFFCSHIDFTISSHLILSPVFSRHGPCSNYAHAPNAASGEILRHKQGSIARIYDVRNVRGLR